MKRSGKAIAAMAICALAGDAAPAADSIMDQLYPSRAGKWQTYPYRVMVRIQGDTYEAVKVAVRALYDDLHPTAANVMDIKFNMSSSGGIGAEGAHHVSVSPITPEMSRADKIQKIDWQIYELMGWRAKVAAEPDNGAPDQFANSSYARRLPPIWTLENWERER